MRVWVCFVVGWHEMIWRRVMKLHCSMHFSPFPCNINVHTNTRALFFPLLDKNRVYSRQQKEEDTTSSSGGRILWVLCCVGFSFTQPWHLMEVKMPSNSFSFLFFSNLMDCMRVNRWLACMCVPVFLFKIGNRSTFFHHFSEFRCSCLLLAATVLLPLFRFTAHNWYCY